MTRWRWLLLVACACTPTSANPAAIDCERPSEGCACPNEGAVIPCYADPARGDGGVECHAGQRGCFDGVWGACEDLHPVELPEDAVASVEAALITGLVAAGIDNATATATAIVFRMVTFYLPPIWGWVALRWLQRHSYL